MVSLPVDVVRFVLLRFAERNLREVIDALDHPCLHTPRVLRSVLYLSDGSLSMLKHYVRACEEDVREVLIQAEFLRNVGDQPLRLRDMSQSFDSDANLGRDLFKRTPKRSADPAAVAPTETELTLLPRDDPPREGRGDPKPWPVASPPAPRPASAPRRRKAAAAAPDHHRPLQGARFHLGSVLYVVADRQPYAEYVCCFRIDRGIAVVIRLPVAFVYEQVAEPIDMSVLEPASIL